MIVKKTVEFEVYSKDIDGKFTWNEAIEACKKLGDGWRLPTREELLLMWENKDLIGNFTISDYWSSSESNSYSAWSQIFSNGIQDFSLKNYYYLRVRPVRDVKSK